MAIQGLPFYASSPSSVRRIAPEALLVVNSSKAVSICYRRLGIN